MYIVKLEQEELSDIFQKVNYTFSLLVAMVNMKPKVPLARQCKRIDFFLEAVCDADIYW